MRAHFKIIMLFLFAVSVKAQQYIEIPIENYWDENYNEIKYVYFKDVNGLLDKYIGTWEYNQNEHYFRIQFYKFVNLLDGYQDAPNKTRHKFDKIYGYFQYKLNGVEIYNTRLIYRSWPFVYSSRGLFFEGSFLLYYEEPSTSPCGRSLLGQVSLQYFNENGIEKLNWSRTDQYSGTFCETGQIEDDTPFQVPANMILIKSEGHEPPPLFKVGN